MSVAAGPGRGGRPGHARAPPPAADEDQKNLTSAHRLGHALNEDIDMGKKNTTAITTTGRPSNALVVKRDVPFRFERRLVVAEAVYRVPALRPTEDGPWSQEADKIAWTDADTGYGIIIRRSPLKLNLCGYVGINPNHPLFGFDRSSIRAVGVDAHGGIDYASPCQKYEPEHVSICHVTESLLPAGQTQRVFANEAADHDDAWWIGFSCDKAGDLVPRPNGIGHGSMADAQAGLLEQAYRDEAYVYHQCMSLAIQLRAIEEGRAPEPHAIDVPPVGVNFGAERG